MSKIFQAGGWNYQDEDIELIESLPDASEVEALMGSYEEVSFDPREVIQIEDQKSQSSCAGHSLTSVVEWCRTIETGETGLQLSRAMAYYEAQRIRGIRTDSGSLISDGVKLAKEMGICEERLWPYPPRFTQKRPSNWTEVLENAGTYKVSRAHNIKSYDQFRAFLGSGQGGIHIGITWNSSVDRGIVDSYSARSGGGHAIAGLCLSDRVDSQGRKWAWIANSWSKRWGQNGWAEWSPSAIDQMLKARWTVMIGLSDMPNVEPRQLTREDWINDFRLF